MSYNKFLAKLASDHRKPDGLFVVTLVMGPSFVEDLPVGRFHGVGPATAAKMEALGIRTGRDLREQTVAFLEARFGKRCWQRSDRTGWPCFIRPTIEGVSHRS